MHCEQRTAHAVRCYFNGCMVNQMKLYNHPLLGEVTMRRSAKASRISIRVKPTEVVLTLPYRGSEKSALAFLDSRVQWVVNARKKITEKQKSRDIILPPFSTRMHRLVLEPGDQSGFKVRLGTVQVIYDRTMDPDSVEVQKLIREALIESYRIEAKALLPGWVSMLVKKHGFTINGLGFRNSRTRWGSCSASNTLSLSIHLLSLPDHLIEYVILHELCHTVHKNHGPNFHALLDRITQGRHSALNNELKNYSTSW